MPSKFSVSSGCNHIGVNAVHSAWLTYANGVLCMCESERGPRKGLESGKGLREVENCSILPAPAHALCPCAGTRLAQVWCVYKCLSTPEFHRLEAGHHFLLALLCKGFLKILKLKGRKEVWGL